MAGNFDDFYAYACLGLDGKVQWLRFTYWRNIRSHVYFGLLPYHCLLEGSSVAQIVHSEIFISLL